MNKQMSYRIEKVKDVSYKEK